MEADAILITGAAGLIGGAVARTLHAAGRRVIGVDLHPPAAAPDYAFALADARDALRHMAILLDGCTAIIHCGAISGPMLGRDNPAMVIDANVRGTTQLLDLARLLRLRRVVACSSVSAYGQTPPGMAPVTEDAPLGAWDIYGASKAAADLVLQAYVRQCGVDAVALRIGWVYGPGRRTDGVLRPMIRSGLGDAACTMEAGAAQQIQFIHVDDVAAALIAALDAPALPRPAYNVTAGPPLTIAAIADVVRGHVPQAHIEIGPGPLPGEPLQAEISIAAAAADFGWRPHIGFSEGVAAYAEWLRTHAV